MLVVTYYYVKFNINYCGPPDFVLSSYTMLYSFSSEMLSRLSEADDCDKDNDGVSGDNSYTIPGCCYMHSK